jgi:hypothetical protein
MMIRGATPAKAVIARLGSLPPVSWLAHALICYGCTVALVPVSQVSCCIGPGIMNSRAHARAGVREIEAYLRQIDFEAT